MKKRLKTVKLKNKNKADPDATVVKFWQKYNDSDYFDRSKIIEKMVEFPIFKEFLDSKANLQSQKYMLKTLLQGYFDDLIMYKDNYGLK